MEIILTYENVLRVFIKGDMYKISVKRNVLESLLLSDGSKGNGLFDNTCMQYAENQLQEMVVFCLISELKAI